LLAVFVVHNHVGRWSADKTIALTQNGKNMEGKEEADVLTMTWNSRRSSTSRPRASRAKP